MGGSDNQTFRLGGGGGGVRLVVRIFSRTMQSFFNMLYINYCNNKNNFSMGQIQHVFSKTTSFQMKLVRALMRLNTFLYHLAVVYWAIAS